MQHTVGAFCPERQRAGRRKWSSRAIVAVPFLCASLMLAISECLNQGSLAAFLLWVWGCPLEAVLNLVVYTSLTWFLILLTNRIDRGCQLALLFMLLPFISVVKRNSLLEPLVPADLKLAGQMTSLVGKYVSPSQLLGVVGGSIGVLLLGLAIRRFAHAKFSIGSRVVGCAMTMLVLLLAGIVPSASGAVLSGPDAEEDLAKAYMTKGFALSFVGLTEQEAFSGVRYSQEVVHEVAKRVRADTRAAEPVVKPDIIVIQSESLWDVTQLPGVRFSQDPLPHLHALQKQGADLQFLSPTFGGGTANPEFELLTGFSMRLVREGTAPFMDPALRRAQPSIARYFSAQGYGTVGIHNFTHTFWQRNYVYPALGFDKFDGTEEAFEDAPRRGDYIADAVLGERVIQRLEQADRPMFIMAITMQNHGSYRPGRYERFDVGVEAPMLKDKQRERLKVYTQGLYESDRMLGSLISYLRNRARPAVLICYGDHLPAISDGYDVLQDTRLVSGSESARDRLLLHVTPAVVWANYPLKLQFAERVMSPGLVWPELLHAMGMEHAFYGTFLDQVRREMPGISRSLYVDAAGNPMLQPPKRANEILSEYWLLQHDLLEAQRCSLGELFSSFEADGIERGSGN